MKEMTRALAAHFSAGAGMPLFLEGWVPPDARPPYMTLALREAEGRRPGELTLRVWHPLHPAGNRQLLETLDALASLVPEGGLRLPCAGGICVLRRSRTGFLELTDTPGRSRAAGGLMRLEVIWYGEEGGEE